MRKNFPPLLLKLLLLLFFASQTGLLSAQTVEAELVSTQKIWDQAPHNAFTDLVRWKGRFYCAFREGQGHVGQGGKLRIIESVDGVKWESSGLLSHPDFDLRDAALTVMPDNRLMVLGGVQHVVDGQRRTGTFVSFTEDGKEYTEPTIVVEPGRWLWRVTLKGDEAFGVSYGAPDKTSSSALLKTSDGLQYETVTDQLFEDGERPTEARIRFAEDGTAYCLHRRDGRTKNTAMLGRSTPPYKDWEWHDLGLRLGGPNFIQLPNGAWIAAGRLYDGQVRTELLLLDVKNNKATSILRLPSGGDTSYPGMVWHDDVLWVSYYASHEERTSIYLAKVKINVVPDSEDKQSESVYQIDDRRELFVDSFLIDKQQGVELRMHSPREEEVGVVFDSPWEGAFSGYVTVLKDDDRYRMYYRGLPGAGRDGTDNEVTCYAESKDGVEWTKPNLGIYEVDGSTENNIVLQGQTPASHNFSPFIDTNPNASPEQRYKALGGTARSGLIAFVSADGLHWTRLQDEAVFSQGAFDSQNVSFWSEAEQCYLCYFRTFIRTEYGRFRTVSRTTSKDFIHWTAPEQMTFGETRFEHLYTNQTGPYYRAPHLYVGVAARFMAGRRVLSAAEAKRINVNPRYFGDISDAILLTSRGGTEYQRTFMESFVRPGIGIENWTSRTNYPALGVVPTAEDEMSIFIQKEYGQPTSHMRRYSMRIDGFSSLEAGYSGGVVETRLLSFKAPTKQQLAEMSELRSTLATPTGVGKSSEAPLFGQQSLRVNTPIAIGIPGTKVLGEQFTLAAHLKDIPAGHRRLFSAYNGGVPATDELIVDFNSAANLDPSGSLRFFCGGIKIGVDINATGTWNHEQGDSKPHHIAVTWDQGVAKVYFDGKLMKTSEEAGVRSIELGLGNLKFGEDYHPASVVNEPLLGQVDDVLVLRKALSDEEISQLAKNGIASLDQGSIANQGTALTFESSDKMLCKNEIGPGAMVLHAEPGTGDRELHLNYSTSAAGSIRVEVMDDQGNPIPGYTAEECDEIIGDKIDQVVTWQGNSELRPLAGKPIRFRFVMKDANLYSLRIF